MLSKNRTITLISGRMLPDRLSVREPGITLEPRRMIKGLQRHSSAIAISVAFYVSTFFAIANLLPLGSHDIALGLFAGAIGGLFALITKLIRDRRARHSALY
jgi:hypothetical protein